MIARCVHFHAHDLVAEKIAIIGVGCPALLVAVPPPFIKLFVAARVLCWDLGRFLEPQPDWPAHVARSDARVCEAAVRSQPTRFPWTMASSEIPFPFRASRPTTHSCLCTRIPDTKYECVACVRDGGSPKHRVEPSQYVSHDFYSSCDRVQKICFIYAGKILQTVEGRGCAHPHYHRTDSFTPP